MDPYLRGNRRALHGDPNEIPSRLPHQWTGAAIRSLRLAAAFVCRIVVGWVFLWSGWGKLNALDRITQNFVEWGVPFPHILTPFVSGVDSPGCSIVAGNIYRRKGSACPSSCAFPSWVGPS